MEKPTPVLGIGDPKRTQRTRTIFGLATGLALWLAVTLHLPTAFAWTPVSQRMEIANVPSKASFSWTSLTPQPHLNYTDCYGGFQCAMLEVQMDWWNHTTDANVSLAVIKKPATVPVTDPQYGGAVLLNPGGPGASGIDIVLGKSGADIRGIIDSKHGKHFDLISFDPRAVGHTKPAVRCFKNKRNNHDWQVREMEDGVFEESDAALARLWAMSEARGGSCSLLDNGEPNMKRYTTTAYVARDMLEIVERHGEWREKEARRLLQRGAAVLKPELGTRTLATTEVKLREDLVYKQGKEKIQYWGFSYGTYLGATFAARYPFRVQRMVLDGVVDPNAEKNGTWSDSLIDASKVLDALYHHCARAGYPACPLANETAVGDTTEEGVKQRVASIMKSLHHNPLPVLGPNPLLITESSLTFLITQGVYSPLYYFPIIAFGLARAETRDNRGFATFMSDEEAELPLPEPDLSENDALMFIACPDGDDQSYVNKTMFVDYVNQLKALSPFTGSGYSMKRMHCIHYTVRPVYRFEGPWKGKTSHPLLTIGNTADPVTPMQNAQHMAAGFEGSVMLTQNSSGHCSSSTPSNCTAGIVKHYFQTGELPPANTTCQADQMPFDPDTSGELAIQWGLPMR